ncbi:12186_t:CDS:2, partial [Racocetra persica]
ESTETESNPMKNTNINDTPSLEYRDVTGEYYISADIESISAEDNHDVNSDINTVLLDN